MNAERGPAVNAERGPAVNAERGPAVNEIPPMGEPMNWAMGRMRRVGSFFLAGSAVVVGEVSIGAEASFWPFTCARGDVAPIVVGPGTAIEDFTMLHCKYGVPLEIGADTVVGHHACVHCRRVGDRVLIGIGARILDEAEIGDDAIVASGAVVSPGTRVPSGKVFAGVPARPLRDVTDEDREYIRNVARRYREMAKRHADGEFQPIDRSIPP